MDLHATQVLLYEFLIHGHLDREREPKTPAEGPTFPSQARTTCTTRPFSQKKTLPHREGFTELKLNLGTKTHDLRSIQ